MKSTSKLCSLVQAAPTGFVHPLQLIYVVALLFLTLFIRAQAEVTAVYCKQLRIHVRGEVFK